MPPDFSAASHAFSRERVKIVHVPVLSGECLGVPEADLQDRERFGWWSRVLASDNVFHNAAWREHARQIFQADLQACARGDRAALGRLVRELPQSFGFPEVIHTLMVAALKYDSTAMEAMLSQLRRTRAKSPLKKKLGAKTKAVLKQVAGVFARTQTEASATPLSVTDAIREVIGKDLEKPAGIKREKAMRANHERAVERWNSYPRAIMRTYICAEHQRQLAQIFGPYVVSEDKAPAILLKPRDKAQRRDPPGISVWPLFDPADGWPGFEGSGKNWSLWLPPLAGYPTAEVMPARHESRGSGIDGPQDDE